MKKQLIILNINVSCLYNPQTCVCIAKGEMLCSLISSDYLKSRSLTICMIPICAGLVFNHFLSGKIKWLDNAMPVVSMFSIAFIIVIITAAGRDNLLSIGPALILIVLIHNLSGYILGYWSARLFKMDERDCRTIAIEVGMQNAGLASGLAKAMGKMATVGLAPAVFGPLMNITGSTLATYWHRKPLVDRGKEIDILEAG